MKIEAVLNDEIQGEFEELKEMEIGGDEYKSTVDGLTKLVDRAIEIKKVNDDKNDRIVKNVLTGISVIGGLGLTVWGSINSWKFEEHGVMSNGPGKEFMKRLFHVK